VVGGWWEHLWEKKILKEDDTTSLEISVLISLGFV
jgi:hypothetical protein